MESGFLQSLELILNFGLPLILLMVAYFIGAWIERRHFRSIRKRESENLEFPVVSFDTMPDDWNAAMFLADLSSTSGMDTRSRSSPKLS